MKYYFKAFENYANFNGRARRREYWYFMLFTTLVQLFLTLIDKSFFANIYVLAVFLPSLAVGVRRMHDVGKSGWYIIIPIYCFILACTSGDHGEN